MSMKCMRMSHAGSAMAAPFVVTSISGISGIGYSSLPDSGCVRLVAAPKNLPWLCVNISTKAASIGLRNAQNANRRATAALFNRYVDESI